MALLSEAERKEYFAFLGYDYNEDSIRALQQKYLRKRDVDGIYGINTDNLVRHLVYVKKYTKNFEPTEFKCECGGRHCTGYPDYMKPVELQHIQKIRDMYGVPITITCGLRCKGYNAECRGSIVNSLHLTGYAIDYYQPGHTVTLAQRKASINDIKKLPNHHYTYGDGINSNGVKVKANYMGNALHTDTQPGPLSPTSDQSTGLTVDGIGGPATVAAMQRFFGTTEDGVISGQNKNLYRYYPSIKSVTFGGMGSPMVIKLQNWAGTKADGVWGKDTSKAVQRKLGVADDGIFGPDSVKALQRFLNSQLFPPEPSPTPTPTPDPDPLQPDYLLLDVSEHQSSIDFDKVKAAGVKGVMVRCAGRGYLNGNFYEDARFFKYIQGAAKAGLKTGVYFFTQAINEAEGREEARYTLDLIKRSGVQLYYPIAIDTEHVTPEKGEKARHNEINKTQRTEAIFGFCDEIEKTGAKAMIYASTSWFNNNLDMSKLPYVIWCAQYYKECQYKGKVSIWQYDSNGKVNGVSGRVDVNRCYISEPSPMPKFDTPVQTPAQAPVVKQKYPGPFPSTKLVKNNSEVIQDVLIFGSWITSDSRFGYGRKGGSKYKGTKEYSITHSGGCHFCGTNSTKINKARKAGLSNPEEWEFTYVCNTFVHACYAHAGVMSMLKASKHAWGIPEYKKSSEWTSVKKPSKITGLRPGDVLARDGHFCLYLGDGKIMEATSGTGGGNPASSKEAWSKSIRICDGASNFKKTTHIFRYTGSVNSNTPIRYGEVSMRVKLMQQYLKWYGIDIADDKIFGDGTLAAVKQFQKDQGLIVDGIAGNDTISKMKEVAL